jgi:general secretion pathway protein H
MEPEQLPSSRAGRASRQGGFTLIEIVAVLAIISLFVAVALPALPLATSRPKLEAIALQAAAIFEGDRYAAMRRHISVASVVDAQARTIRSSVNGRSVEVPLDVSFDALLARSCAGLPTRGVIVFLPNGLSCGGVVALSRSGVGFEIRVNWLTGGTEIVPRMPS